MAIASSPVHSAERQAALLAQADQALACGGLGMFALPPEVNLVVAEGRGSHITDVASGRLMWSAKASTPPSSDINAQLSSLAKMTMGAAEKSGLF